MKEEKGDNTRTVDAQVIEVKEKTVRIKTESGEEKTIKKELINDDVSEGDTLEVVIKDKPLSHKVTNAKLITRGENSIELLKLLGLTSLVVVICFILMYSGFISYWFDEYRAIVASGTTNQALHIADIMTNLIGVFVIATAAIITIIWKIYLKDDDMKSDEVLKLLAIVTLATVICYIIVYLSFYNSWAGLINEVIMAGSMTDRLLVSTIMSKLLGVFVIGSLFMLNIIWDFYIHHKEFVKSIESKKE